MASERRPVGPTLIDNSPLCAAVKNFKSFVGRIEHTFGVSLPVPQFESLASLKKFCTGLLLPSSNHSWLRPIKGLTLRDRLSISGSLFLFRKVLPSEPPSLSAYRDKMSVPSPAPDPKFLRFISSEIGRMFPVGWDAKWKGCVMGTTVRPSSCLESSRRRGGALGALDRSLLADREAFCAYLLDKYSRYDDLTVSRVRVAVAMTSGKSRIVTVNSVDMTYLDPLHRLIYDRVSEQKWCLRGDARACRFQGFTAKEGEVFVSGDYESATDNLNQNVARHVLYSIVSRCSRVPLGLRELAMRSLECTATSPVGDFPVRRGQLMGNSLSFPLLCLQNWLAFRYAVPRDVPVKINGDDIVFRASTPEYESWKRAVGSGGLTLSEGKTAVSHNWFSLNSTFFCAGTKHVKEAPVVRSTAFFTRPESVDSIGGRLETLRRFSIARRSYLSASLLQTFGSMIWKSGRSLTRGLGWRLTRRIIVESGFARRESFYLSLDKQYDPPPDKIQIGYYQSSVPPGWVRVRSRSRVDALVQRDFFQEVVDRSWRPTLQRAEPKVRYTFRYVKPPAMRYARWLGLSRDEYRSRFSLRLLERDKGVPRWVRQRGGESISFVPAR
jgi:hypothetical protein